MKIAILTQYYPPETGAPQNRLSDLARRLRDLGHQVQVLTALPNYPGDAIQPEYLGRENTWEQQDGIRIARVALYVPREKTFAKRMRCYLSFAANAWRYGPRLLDPADVLLLESPPLFLGLAAVPLARRLGARLVTNISDLWPRTAVELGIVGPGVALWLAERLEAWLYGNSWLITGQTLGIVSDIKRRFPDQQVVLFPNGVDMSAYDHELDGAAVRREFGWGSETFVLGYTGLLGYVAALDQVIDAAKLFGADEAIHVALFGDGPCRDHLRDRIAREGLTSVALYPRQPAERMPEIQAAFDAGLVPVADRPLFRGTRPAKMFEFMAAGKPVVLCAHGEAVDILNLAEGGPAGVVCPPEAPEQLAAAIRSLRSRPEWSRGMGKRGRVIVRSHFNRADIARRLEETLRATFYTDPRAAAPSNSSRFQDSESPAKAGRYR